MKKQLRSFIFILSLAISSNSFAQLVGGSIYFPGRYLEIGQALDGSFGAGASPAGYYPYSGWSNIASVYDWGHDGWTVGAPAQLGDYTYPGTPFEGWSMQANGTRSDAFYTDGTYGVSYTGALTGGNVAYSNLPGPVFCGAPTERRLIGTWAGSASGLTIHTVTRVDTNASWVVMTTSFINNTAASIPGVYFWRTSDPDNDETFSGYFETNNFITHQNETADHPVMVSSYGTVYNQAYMALATKDCRAKAMIYESWAPYPGAGGLDQVYAGTAGFLGTTYYGLNTETADQDIAIGLIYNLGTIAAGDSAVISYAYIYNSITGIDSAFPEPKLYVNCVPIAPSGAAPAPTYDTFNACLYPGMTILPVNIRFGDDKCWYGSTWTWTSSTGLATTTGVNNTISLGALPPIITYTITGTNPAFCAARTMYLTIRTCNGATVNSPCLGDSLIFNAPGDSTGATYVWVGPNSYTTTVATTQSFTVYPSVWADTGTYRVIKTVGGIHDTSTAIAIIKPYPVISGPTQVCAGSSITLSSSISGLTWSANPTGVATIGATTGILTGVAPGVVTIYCPPLGTGCTSSYVVTVNPIAPITGVASLCMNTTTQLSNAVSGGTWNSSTPAIATVNTTGLVTGVAGGTSTISYTTASGCLSTIIVTVHPVAAITGTTIVCAGGTTTLANTVAGGTWSSSNMPVATIGLTTGIVSGHIPGSTLITYITPFGCISTTTVNVVVVSAITGRDSVCQGSTTVLADGAGGGAWTSSNTAVATIGVSNGIVTGVSGGTTNITYTGGAGCYTSTVVTVDPISPITGTLTMCQYFTTTLGDALPGGTWSSSNMYVATVNTSTGLVYGVAGGTSTITYTSSSGCIMTAVVTVHPKPAPPVPHDTTYCQLYPMPNPVSASGTGTLTWYGPGVTGPLPAAPTPLTGTPGAFDYYVTQTSAFGCVSDSAEVVITITQLPAPPIVRDSAFCQGSPTVPLNYQVDSASGSYLKWYNFATGGAPLGGAPTPQDSIVTYPNPIPWYVTQTVNGCESFRAPITDTIVYKPSFTITASRTWVCDHDTLSFKYHGPQLSFGAFVWTLPPGTTIVGGSVTDSVISVRFDTVFGPHILYLTASELHGMCDSTVPIQVSVIPLPTTHCYMNPNICIGDTTGLALTDESSGASVFSWYIDGTPLGSSTKINLIAANSNSGGPFSISWNDTGMHFITVSCTTNQGCRSTPTHDTVEVHSIPNATFTFKTRSTGALCLEDSVLFIANYQNYNCSYFWQPVHAFNNDNKWQIWGKVEEEQSNITLTVSDPFGCVGTSTQEITPSACCTVLFPNAFTPNGDGHNDYFRPIFNGYHKFHAFRIVNRWGQTVFESDDSNPMWDGNFNGVPQDIGTYYYYIQYDCGGNTIEAKGDCTLIR